MAETTENYGLTTAVSADDFIEPEHNNRIADTVDHVLGSVLRRLLTPGVHEGWSILADRSVGAGQGLVGACWCRTVEATPIAGLTDGAVNYVFLEASATAPRDGSVSVFGQLSASGPDDAIYLGTIELASDGTVVAIDNAAAGVDRQCYALAWVTLRGSGTEPSVPAGGDATFTVSHDPLRIPGAITLESSSPDFTWEITGAHAADGFAVTCTNNGGSAADFEYTWEREGIAP